MTKGQPGVPQVWELRGGDRGYRVLRDMTSAELAKRDADHKAYKDMLARQEAYMSQRLAQVRERTVPDIKGCVFAKSCDLPDAIIDYHNPTGYIPTEMLSAYGAFTLLGGREVNESGCVPLKKISGTLPASIGTFALGGTALASLSAGAALATAATLVLLITLQASKRSNQIRNVT